MLKLKLGPLSSVAFKDYLKNKFLIDFIRGRYREVKKRMYHFGFVLAQLIKHNFGVKGE